MNTKSDIIEVSVIIPNFNYGNYIEECITSVIKSDFNKLEVIVIDDGSTDNSAEIVKRIIQKTTVQIHLIEKPSQTGQSKTRNLGIQQAKGSYLFFLDSDNYIRQDCIRKHFEFLSANPDYTVAYAPIQRFNDTTGENLYVFSNEPFNAEKLTHANYIDNMAMVRKDDFLEAGMFDENVNGWEDYELWLKLIAKNKKMHLIEGEPLSFYRVHDNSWSYTVSRSSQNALKEYIDRKHNLNISEGIENNNVSDNYQITAISKARVQVYWAAQEGQFTEERSQTKFLKLTNFKQTLTLDIHSKSEEIQYLRLDIADRVGILNIHTISIQDSSGLLLWDWNKNELKQKSDVLFVESFDFFQEKTIQLSTGPDPQLIIPLINLTSGKSPTGIIVQVELSQTSIEELDLLNKTINKPLTYISPEDIKTLQITIDYLQNEKNDLLNEVSVMNTNVQYAQNENKLLNEHVVTKNHFIDELIKEKDIIKQELQDKQQVITQLYSDKEKYEADLTIQRNATLEVGSQKDLLINTVRNQQNHISQINKEKQELFSANNALALRLDVELKSKEEEREKIQQLSQVLLEKITFFEEKINEKNFVQGALNKIFKK